MLVNRANRDLKQEGVFLLLLSGERRIKRVQRLAGRALYLISDNELYQPEMIKPQDMGGWRFWGDVKFELGCRLMVHRRTATEWRSVWL